MVCPIPTNKQGRNKYSSTFSLADLGGGVQGTPPGPKFLHFHAVFGKNWSNSRLASLLGNPGSATDFHFVFGHILFSTKGMIWYPWLLEFYLHWVISCQKLFTADIMVRLHWLNRNRDLQIWGGAVPNITGLCLGLCLCMAVSANYYYWTQFRWSRFRYQPV